jgi:hypothetical protein
MAYKGKYRIKNLEKYVGDPTNVTYRSLWERKFMKYCEENPNIIQWSSEEIVIPYRSPVDKKIHRYFPDFWIKIQRNDKKMECIIVEIKPKIQTVPPVKKSKTTKKFISEVYTYGVNEAKWAAAKEYCADRNWKFEIITEDHLFN